MAEKKEVYSVRIRPSLKEDVESMAAKDNKTFSEAINRLLEQYIKGVIEL